ncbi:MAG: alginate export family protein [Pirellulaceae bacterium]
MSTDHATAATEVGYRQEICSSCNAPVVSANCSCPTCQPAKKAPAKKPNPCATSHKNIFYLNDFSYLKDPCYSGCCLGDGLKLMPVGPCGEYGTLDVGGQLRFRYHHEKGMGQNPGLTRFQQNSNDFLLSRMRLYSDWKVNDCVRFYAEGIYAGVTGPNDYIPRAIDENYGDLNNLFVDLKMTDSTTVRLGRQELQYGGQRLVSPLDWANTRRKFEGINILHRQGDWATDVFYTNFVPVDANDFDEADYDQSFYGMYTTYSGLENASLDVYYLGYDHQANGAPITTDFSLHTFGARLNGSLDDWLYEVEGGPQFGRQSGLGLDHTAGFFTAGIGRKIKQAPWNTTLWVYYDYASGNNIGGDFNRFNQLFPLAHKYLGFNDAVARSNIESPNVLLTMKPTDKLSLLLWYYHFMSNQDTDIVPSIGGTPAQSTTSKDFGDELDLIATYSISPRSQILFGWSHLWAGNKIITANRSDEDFFYTEFTLNF